MKCKCFRCGNGYNSSNPDDVAGDGRCPACAELGKKIAFELDIKMAEFRRKNPIQPSPYKKLLEQLPSDANGRIIINARDLGVDFRP